MSRVCKDTTTQDAQRLTQPMHKRISMTKQATHAAYKNKAYVQHKAPTLGVLPVFKSSMMLTASWGVRSS